MQSFALGTSVLVVKRTGADKYYQTTSDKQVLASELYDIPGTVCRPPTQIPAGSHVVAFDFETWFPHIGPGIVPSLNRSFCEEVVVYARVVIPSQDLESVECVCCAE